MVERLASHYLEELPQVDVAVLLPHPGDAELLCGATIARLAAAGKRVAILDLTAGEAGTHTVMERKLDDAERAAAILGAYWRGCVRFPDARLDDTIMSRMTITGEIKRLRPRTLVAMHWDFAHPDALPASRMVENSAYLARLGRLDNYLDPTGDARVVFASSGLTCQPSFVADATDHFEAKLEAIRAYSTLFADRDAALAKVEREARRLGDLIGVRYGEAFVQRAPLRGDVL